MKRKVILIVTLSISLVAIIIFMLEHKDTQFNKFTEQTYATPSESFIDYEGVMLIEEPNNTIELDMVISECKKQGYDGVVVHESLYSIGEGYIPSFAKNMNITEWYVVSTDSGLKYFVVENNTVVQYEDN